MMSMSARNRRVGTGGVLCENQHVVCIGSEHLGAERFARSLASDTRQRPRWTKPHGRGGVTSPGSPQCI